MKNIAIFASGSGSNAQNIAEYFINTEVSVKIILSNKPDAYVLERAKQLNIPSVVFNRDQFYNSNYVLDILKSNKIDFVVLAGFLWLVPNNLLEMYPSRIINVHPALLPKFGGKGMYGDIVHQAVVENREKVSGITIHYINGKYDEGDIVFQAKCDVLETDTASDVANKVHKLEYEHFPRVIGEVLKSI
jgi:phosphoribosylglycinamide formyltransferase 1